MAPKDFYQLDTWITAKDFLVKLYLATDDFPGQERYNLVDQMRRAALSVTSNLSEGYGRRSKADKLRFYNFATSSATEVKGQLIISKDLGYLSEEQFHSLWELIEKAHKQLNALITSVRTRYH